MDVELMQKIIELIGGATDNAVMIAVLWIVGGYLVKLIGWLLMAYIAKLIVSTAYSYATVDVDKGSYNYLVDCSVADKGRIRALETEIKNMESTHRVELERIKHLYKILKDSENDKSK